MHLVISHTTTYTYETPPRYGLQELRLRPLSQPGQTVITWDTTIEGGTHELFFDDEYANRVELVSLAPGATETTITATGEVETFDTAGVLPRHQGHTPLWLYRRTTPRTTPGSGVRRLAANLDESHDDTTRLHTLSSQLREQVDYQPGRSDMGSTAEDVIEAGAGVCQDHAHVFIAVARELGYPARYVSGYLFMENTVHQDASHAWAEVWVDALGWVGFDVSNGISPDERYVRVAVGLEYGAAAPISGVRYGAGAESLEVELQVQSGGGAQQQ